MGPPGVGKGTQAKILSKILNITHLSTGEILRNEIKMNTEIGKIAKSFIDHGNFCLLYTSPSPRDRTRSRMPSSA